MFAPYNELAALQLTNRRTAILNSLPKYPQEITWVLDSFGYRRVFDHPREVDTMIGDLRDGKVEFIERPDLPEPPAKPGFLSRILARQKAVTLG